jgi:gamma-glutamyltranspeptidase/glutathione hydrolase
MSDFTTRPEIRGTFGVVTSTHWIASATGMGILEKGGNAFDAAVATALVLQIVEPQLNGPAGDMPAILHSAKTGKTEVLCAQGVAPAKATIEHFTDLGLTLVPGSGLLATVVPGAFDGWMLLLRDHGSLRLRDVMQPAIDYARDGHPILPRVANVIAGLEEFFTEEWPSSAKTWLVDGAAPKPNELFKNPDLANTYERLVAAGERASTDRLVQIDVARKEWSQGFVADAIFDYLKDAEVMDVSGSKHRAVLAPDDMANWQASYEETLSLEYHGWRVHKTQAWGQGPVLLQALSILKHADLGNMDPVGAEFVHVIIEAIKLAYADREAYYGDPDHSEIPMDHLLSDAYCAARFALIKPGASLEQRPGLVPGFEHLAKAYVARSARNFNAKKGVSAGEPTMAHLTEKRGDTVHLDVIDRWGNMIAATPSGGWLQSSPVIPGLGFPLNSRAQMFWLEPGLASSLAPGSRPRTTLTPSYAEKDGVQLVFGTPGGDQQDQWQLIWFLRLVHFGMELQQCMDAPLFHSMHFQGSFYPREALPGEMMIEPAFDTAVIDDLRVRGHRVTVSEPWAIGRLTAAMREPGGMLRAAATPRLMQAYAVGR